MRGIKLIFCAGGNKERMQVALEEGWAPGTRSDYYVYPHYRPLALLDVHWEGYDWPAHLRVAQAEHPWMAAVPDTMSADDLSRTLAMAEEIAPCCAHVMVIPKAPGVVPALPRVIGGTPVVLGYSVPTRYGATPLPVWDFSGWPVHLLGGTPLGQVRLAHYMDVVSADGNVACKVALRGAVITERGGREQLHRILGYRAENMPLVALRHSLRNIRTLWQRAGFVLDNKEALAWTNAPAG